VASPRLDQKVLSLLAEYGGVILPRASDVARGAWGPLAAPFGAGTLLIKKLIFERSLKVLAFRYY